MQRLIVVLVASVCFFVAIPEALAECPEDEDSSEKGDDDECDEPKPRRIIGYGAFSVASVSALFGEIVSRRVSSDPDVVHSADYSANFLPGAHIAAFLAPQKNIHLGIYGLLVRGKASIEPELPEDETWITPENKVKMTRFGFGIVLKTEIHPNKRIFLGIDVGIGMHKQKFDTWESTDQSGIRGIQGIEVSPTLIFDILVFEKDSKQIRMPVRVGVDFLPLAKGFRYKDNYGNDTLTYELNCVSLVATIGLAFGRFTL